MKWIEHKGKKILYVDYSGLREADMIANLEVATNEIVNSKDKIVYLANFENTVVSNDFMSKATSLGKKSEPNTEKSAVIGVSGMKKVLLNTYSMLTGAKMKAYDSLEQAKNALAN